jgi:hypothetical protein
MNKPWITTKEDIVGMARDYLWESKTRTLSRPEHFADHREHYDRLLKYCSDNNFTIKEIMQEASLERA